MKKKLTMWSVKVGKKPIKIVFYTKEGKRVLIKATKTFVMKKPIVKSISQLKKLADKIFSLWVRDREKYCVTCGSRNNLQCGHYVSRSHNSLRFSEVNCHTQCVGCNVFKRGNMDEYARFMIRTYGADILEKLAKEKQKLHQFTRAELTEIIQKYKVVDNHI